MVGKVIYNLLTTSTELTALISGKVFPLISEDETIINYIVYERRSTQPTNTKLKRSTVDVISYDIMIFTDGLEIMNDIALGVRNALDQYKGVNSGLWIDNIVYTGENDEYEPESNVFGKFMSFDVRFNNIYSTLKQPTNLTTTATSTEITLNWDDNATGETGYKVYRSTNLRDYELITSLGGGIETYEDTDVVIDTIYYYFIVPYNSVGNGYASDVVADKLGGGDIIVTFDNYLIEETSVDLNIDCTTYLNMAILSDNADVNGNWLESGTNLGKPRFVYEDDNSFALLYNGTQWEVDAPPFISILATAGNEAYPWLATWSGVTVKIGTIEEYCSNPCADATVTVNGDAFGTVASADFIDVPVEYVNGDVVPTTIVSGVVQVPNPITQSGIAYQRPQPTGQEVTYRTGDDYWQVLNNPYAANPTNPTHVATLVNSTTLAQDNVFGNKHRFTNQSGAAAFNFPIITGADVLTTDTAIDHYTGLEWAINDKQLANNKNWNNAIDECLALNARGFDDWYLPNAQECFSVTNFNRVGASTSLIFGVATRILLTSTTDKSDILYNAVFNASANIINLYTRVLKTTASYNYYPVRKRY